MSPSQKKKHDLFLVGYGVLLMLVSALAADCSPSQERHGSKPAGLELPPPAYVVTPDSLPFRFEVSARARFTCSHPQPDTYFFDVAYPDLHARLYATWHRVDDAAHFVSLAEESRRMVYAHAVKATAIDESPYVDDTRRAYGLVYDLQGPVATPLQVSLTDTTRFFLHASLYFEQVADSVATEVVEYVRTDVTHMLHTFEGRP